MLATYVQKALCLRDDLHSTENRDPQQAKQVFFEAVLTGAGLPVAITDPERGESTALDNRSSHQGTEATHDNPVQGHNLPNW